MDLAIKGKGTKVSKGKRLVGLVAASVLLVAAILYFSPTSMEKIPPIPIQSGLITDSVPVNAVMIASRAGSLATVSGGIIAEVIAHEGQVVKLGDPLLKLTNAAMERQLAEAQSELAGARSELISQQADAADQVDLLAVTKIKAANALTIAEMQLEAERKLQAQGIISLLTLKKTEAERDGKQVDLDYATHHAVKARAASQAKLAAVSERAALLQARTDSLKESVDALTFKAPFDGVVSKIDGKPGASIAPGTNLAEVITADLQISLEVAEQFASAIQPGQLLRLQGGLTGKVLSLAPASDGGVVKGRASIDGDTSKLRSNTTIPGEAILADHGMGLFVQIEGAEIANRIVSATVQTTDGRTELRQIRFGRRYRQKVVVLDGASNGESIVGLDGGEVK